MQNNDCQHEFLCVTEVDKDYGILSYRCKCLDCGAEKGDLASKFNYNSLYFVGTMSGSYESMKEAFESYKNDGLGHVHARMRRRYRA